MLVWLRPARLWARKCTYFPSFWQRCATAPWVVCAVALTWDHFCLGAVVYVGADRSSRGLPFFDWAQRCSCCVEGWKTFRGCWFQAHVLGLAVLSATKQGLCVDTEAEGLCRKCQFSRNWEHRCPPCVRNTVPHPLCLLWGCLKYPPLNSKLGTLMMGEQRAESSFDLLSVLLWGCWFTRADHFFHEVSKKPHLIERGVGTLLKRDLENEKMDKEMGNWCSFCTDLETCYKNIWSSWTPHLYGYVCQKLNVLVDSVRTQLIQQS